MKSLPAPFLVQDADIEHGIFCLERHAAAFAGCDVTFIVPFTDRQARVRYRAALPGVPIRFVHCASALDATLAALLSACGDADWVLWLTADRYPIAHLQDGALQRICGLAAAGALEAYDAVKFCRWREVEVSDAAPVSNPDLADRFESRPYTRYGFWHPHLVRRAVLQAIVADVTREGHPRDFNAAVTQVSAGLTGPTLFPKAALLKLEEPLDRGLTTLNYAARRARAGLVPIAPNHSGDLTCGFNAPHAARANHFWRSAGTPPARVVRDPLPDSPFHVLSFGGSGSKVLADALFAQMVTGNNMRVDDLHSHRRIPPAAIPTGQQLIYVFADPRDAVMSFFERRKRRTAAHNFEGYSGRNSHKPMPQWVMKHLELLQAAPGPITADWDLPRYLAQPQDLFRLDEHLDNWLYARASYRITFVRYDTLWDNADALAQHLGLDSLNLRDRVPRSSNWRDLGLVDQGRLDARYGPLADRMAALPDVFMAQGGRICDLSGRPIRLTTI